MTALRTIGRLARASPRLYAATATLIILAGYLLPLVPGLLVRQVIDALGGHAMAGWNAATLLALLAVVAVLRTLAEAGSNVAESSQSLVAATLLRRNLLQQLLERPGALPGSPGEAIGRLRSDVEEVAAYVPWTADPLGQALAFVLGLAVLASIDAPLALLVCALLLVVAALGSRMVARLEAYRQANQEAIGQVTGLLGELFGAVLAIKTAGAERRVVAHLEAINERRRRAGLRDQVYTQGFVGLAQNAANVGAGLLLLAAAGAMRGGRFTVGDFALFVSYLGSLAQAAGWLGVYLTRYQQMGVSLARVRALLPAKGAADQRAGPPPASPNGRPPSGELPPLPAARSLARLAPAPRTPGPSAAPLTAPHAAGAPPDHAGSAVRQQRHQGRSDGARAALRPPRPACAPRSRPLRRRPPGATRGARHDRPPSQLGPGRRGRRPCDRAGDAHGRDRTHRGRQDDAAAGAARFAAAERGGDPLERPAGR